MSGVAGDDVVAAEVAAIRLLAAREHGRAELSAKLQARGHGADSVASALQTLEQRGLFSERRFVESFLHQRVRKGYGPLRIRAELAKRGVASEQVEQCLEEASVDWEDSLRDAARRKFGDRSVADFKALARRGRQLEQRGFPAGLVRRYLNSLTVGD